MMSAAAVLAAELTTAVMWITEWMAHAPWFG